MLNCFTASNYILITNMNCLLFGLKFTAGCDYESVSQDLLFTASPVLTQCVNITIIQDGAVENLVEFFSVQASTSNSSINGLPTSTNVTIQEDSDRK